MIILSNLFTSVGRSGRIETRTYSIRPLSTPLHSGDRGEHRGKSIAVSALDRSRSRSKKALGTSQASGRGRGQFCSVYVRGSVLSCCKEYQHQKMMPVSPLTKLSANLSQRPANLSVMKIGSRICAEKQWQNPVLRFTCSPASMSGRATAMRAAKSSRQLTFCGRFYAGIAAKLSSLSSCTTANQRGGIRYSGTAGWPHQRGHSFAKRIQCKGLGAAVTHMLDTRFNLDGRQQARGARPPRESCSTTGNGSHWHNSAVQTPIRCRNHSTNRSGVVLGQRADRCLANKRQFAARCGVSFPQAVIARTNSRRAI